MPTEATRVKRPSCICGIGVISQGGANAKEQKESKATREEIRSMTEVLVSHDHSTDGQPVFRVPPARR